MTSLRSLIIGAGQRTGSTGSEPELWATLHDLGSLAHISGIHAITAIEGPDGRVRRPKCSDIGRHRLIRRHLAAPGPLNTAAISPMAR